ncbi:MAG: zinc ribbon domain-containing protein [Bacteroidales bacterium]|nr:zinc ribbon domain-containing protein [Bacteroidales bacterium]
MIPPPIISLVSLALKDAVMTYRERQTIINEAQRIGANIDEVEAYINQQLNIAISNRTKEQLKRCTHCGGQIPLISDQCPYCGQMFATQQQPGRTVYNVANSQAASIINAENQKTESERKNITQCPSCGAPFPLISNICTSCGYVLHEQQDSTYNIRNLISSISHSINELKKCKVPFAKAFKHIAFVYCLIFSFISLMFFSHANDKFLQNIFALLWATSTPLAGVLYFVNKSYQNPTKIADDVFYAQLHQYEKVSRQVATIYGNSQEAQQELKKFKDKIDSVIAERRKNRITNLATISIILIALIAIANYGNAQKEYEINTEAQKKEHQLLNRTVTLTPASIYKGQKVNVQGMYGIISQYLQLESDATLSVKYEDDFPSGKLNTDSINTRLRVTGLRLSSTGKILGNQCDTLAIILKVLDADGNILGNSLDVATLQDKNYSLQPIDTLPDGKPLNFRTLVSEGKYSCIEDFRSNGKTSLAKRAELDSLLSYAKYFVIMIM